ncbi:MAG TPA: Bax inhibitor-1/YccA family protein [Tepidisphaeraceae bacterium]|jgi:FtsH-binding integral membrane protein|nr:Bax inhibitor-1/YccA family protein [Tepidisphaeraceae bacterium]
MSQYPDYARRVELEYGTSDKVVFNFFNQVYAWMFAGLAVTATVALLASRSMPTVRFIYASGLYLPLVLGLVAVAWGVQKAAIKMGAAAATGLFLVYAALVGLMICGIFLRYPASTLVGTFVVTAGVFGGMSVFGFVTKRDLTTIGSYLVMAFWGIFLASIVNFFLANQALDWIITYVGVFVFIGLTAYDTQKLKNIAHSLEGNPSMAARMSIIGSLILYVDFINLFLFLLRIMGRRR